MTRDETLFRFVDCKHGRHNIHSIPGQYMIYSCPTDYCDCCGEFYGWSDTMYIKSSEDIYGEFYMPKKTCQFCGGHYQKFGDHSGVKLYINEKWINATEYAPEVYSNLPTYDEVKGMLEDRDD